jgi:serine/threonine-protein kinase
MKCPKCQAENPDLSKYCNDCGESFDISVTKTLETTTHELKRGTIYANRYEVIEELGAGGMGEVYRVYDKKIEEEVALKLLKPEISSNKRTIERFKNEIRIARKISHRNVCRMHDLNEESGTQFITMEYVPGEDLKSFILRARHLPVATALSIAKQVCDGLAEAHTMGIIHRDLKPQNIMIDKSGNAKIMDFGIARSFAA